MQNNREAEVKKLIDENKIITIVRGIPDDLIVPLAEALYNGGIRLLEITVNQNGDVADTVEPILRLREKFDGKLCIGAGTVMSTAQADAVIDAGAEYIISPNVNEAVIARTKEYNAVSIPGALTPTEIASAYEYGADYVKVFPVDAFPLPYCKSIMAPISHIPLLAVGNVNSENAGSYIRLGFKGVGVGTSVINKQMLVSGDYAGIEGLARQLVKAVTI